MFPYIDRLHTSGGAPKTPTLKMAKSPTKRSRRKDSPFTKEQEIWIVSRCAFMTSAQLRRAFIIQFLDPKKTYHLAPNILAFTRLVERFKKTGGVTGCNKGSDFSAITPENIKRVDDYFSDNSKKYIKDACDDLGLTFGTVWRILRKHLGWKAYKPIRVNRLTEQNKQDRMTAARWFLAKGDDFLQRVLFSDEKWFVLHPAPNSQTDRIWAPAHPDEEIECRYQGMFIYFFLILIQISWRKNL